MWHYLANHHFTHTILLALYTQYCEGPTTIIPTLLIRKPRLRKVKYVAVNSAAGISTLISSFRVIFSTKHHLMLSPKGIFDLLKAISVAGWRLFHSHLCNMNWAK